MPLLFTLRKVRASPLRISHGQPRPPPQKIGLPAAVPLRQSFLQCRRRFLILLQTRQGRGQSLVGLRIVGINLKGTKPTKRLEASGSFNAMVTHRVRLQSADDVDDAVRSWLLQAWEAVTAD